MKIGIERTSRNLTKYIITFDMSFHEFSDPQKTEKIISTPNGYFIRSVENGTFREECLSDCSNLEKLIDQTEDELDSSIISINQKISSGELPITMSEELT